MNNGQVYIIELPTITGQKQPETCVPAMRLFWASLRLGLTAFLVFHGRPITAMVASGALSILLYRGVH